MRARPKLDVESIRNSGARDLRSVLSENCPDFGSRALPACSHCSAATVVVQRDFELSSQVDLMSVVYVCRGIQVAPWLSAQR